ncbi:MAG: hypothetical protein QNI99_03025 [Woeseiaceae bacterium]|nr:hypothetical protein [Woeseiaceae bacterium]
MSVPTHTRIVALLVATLAVQYLIVISWATFGDHLIFYQTEHTLRFTLETHLLINRTIYWALGIGLLAAALMIVNRPIWASILLLCSIPFVINDDTGTAFELTANIIGVGSGSTELFDFWFNEIKLTLWLWYLSIVVVSVGFLCSVAEYFRQRRETEDDI